jgi:hypothetical protein
MTERAFVCEFPRSPNETTVSDTVQQPWVALAGGFVYGPFGSRQEAGTWCAKEHKRNARVLPLNSKEDACDT